MNMTLFQETKRRKGALSVALPTLVHVVHLATQLVIPASRNGLEVKHDRDIFGLASQPTRQAPQDD